MLRHDWKVQGTRHRLVYEDVFPMKQWQSVVCVSSSELVVSLSNDCDEPVVDYVAD